MNVSSYLFQSPYPSPVQVGRADPSTQQEEQKTQSNAEPAPQTDQKQQEAQAFAASQIKEVAPVVESKKLLDVYA